MTRTIAVIGGGLAGLEIAAQLASRAGTAVVVVETGPSTRRRHVCWDTSIQPGDEKIRRWTSDGWGFGAGLSERLGGRSLCYHGVLLGLSSDELLDWHPRWRERLVGARGLYARVCDDLRPVFPELQESELSVAAARVGFRRVPQAARIDDATGQFEAYSPLSEVLRLAATDDRLRIVRGRACSLRRTRGRWEVELADAAGKVRTLPGFDVCVLAASAIGNIQLLAQTTAESMTTTITDHFCVGAVARVEPGEPLEAFRHPMLWTGYRPIPSLSANVFVVERPSLPNGDRIIVLMAVIEQGSGPADFSALTVQPSFTEGVAAAHIATAISAADLDRISRVQRELLRLADVVSRGSLLDITPPRPDGASPAALVGPSGGHGGPGGAPRSDGDAVRALLAQSQAGRVVQFGLPYGSFEHESCSHPVGGTPGVTPDLEVDSLPGVYLAGPGNFTRLGVANPTLTIIAMSRWLADSLADSLAG